jgi:hypothetical protein
MINFDRDRFDSMNTEQKIVFVNNLVLQNTQLTPEEIQYLVPENREKYFHNRVRTSNWLEDYEFDNLQDDEKEIYITNKRFIDKGELSRLSQDLQKKYIATTISTGIQLTPEEFNSLENDDVRGYYVNQKLLHSIDTTFTSQELTYLESGGQIKYINTLFRMGLSPNPDEIKIFKPEAFRYYQSHKTLNEIRSIIKSGLKKVLK